MRYWLAATGVAVGVGVGTDVGVGALTPVPMSVVEILA